MKNILVFLSVHKEKILVGVLLMIAGIAHGYNMFAYPYYENDEGTYISQAWALTQGKLAPYTYWYDHAPGGWIALYLWTLVTGGFFTFGMSVNSGRVLMLILHVVMCVFIYSIGKKMTKSRVPGTIAILLFSLSPLAIYFQRRVLLDNIMIFWILFSLVVLYRDKLKLRHIIVSALSFGIAVLTKENAIFFLPAFIYIIYHKAPKPIRFIASAQWFAIVSIEMSLYAIYALIKGEFFPYGTFLGGNQPHVSLLQSLYEQSQRGGAFPVWDTRSEFYGSMVDWLRRDAYLVYAGVGSILVGLFLSIKIHYLRPLVLLCILFVIFLLRGKLVLNFYIVPLIPLVSLLVGVELYLLFRWVSVRNTFLYRFVTTAGVIGLLVFFFSLPREHYVKNDNQPYVQTVAWIKQNLPRDTRIVIDNAIFVDLHALRNSDDLAYPNADWYSKLDNDPEIFTEKYGSDWKNIRYLTVSHEMLKQMNENRKTSVVKKAFDNSTLVEEWKSEGTTYRDLAKYMSTDGDWMAIYKVGESDEIALNASWRNFNKKYIKTYGQVVHPQKKLTSVQYQADALLRAVWMNDKNTFDGVYAWTRDHLQYRPNDKLFSRLWEKTGIDYKVTQYHTSSGADTDIALALILAYNKWNDTRYLESARALLGDIWKHEVVTVNGTYFMLSGTDGERSDGYIVLPYTLSPYAYRVFAEVDTSRPWAKLADDSYKVYQYLLQRVPVRFDVPVFIAKRGGTFSTLPVTSNRSTTGSEGYESSLVLHRVSQSALWHEDKNALAFLQKVTGFLDTSPNATNIASDLGMISLLRVTDTKAGDQLYTNAFASQFDYDAGEWKHADTFEDQIYAWFAVGFYNDRMSTVTDN